MTTKINSNQAVVADSTQDGFLSSGDWSTFNGKQDALTSASDIDANSILLNPTPTIVGHTDGQIFYDSVNKTLAASIAGDITLQISQESTTLVYNGTGISVTGTYPNFTVTNTAPDQTVAIASGTGITVTGTYPNFTVAETTKASYQAIPVDPGTTSSTTGVMMGLAGAITPAVNGKILIIISGDVDNGTNARGSKMQIRYGTGAAPNNGVALTGTAVGALQNFFQNNANERHCFSVQAVVTGLSVGTPYWVDLSLASVTGGTSRVRDISISIIEV